MPIPPDRANLLFFAEDKIPSGWHICHVHLSPLRAFQRGRQPHQRKESSLCLQPCRINCPVFFSFPNIFWYNHRKVDFENFFASVFAKKCSWKSLTCTGGNIKQGLVNWFDLLFMPHFCINVLLYLIQYSILCILNKDSGDKTMPSHSI